MWRTLEELTKDHERLVAEVEELKRRFEEKAEPRECAFCHRLATEITQTCDFHRPL